MLIEKIIKDNAGLLETPYYLYSYDDLKQSTRVLLNTLPQKSELLYSIKANPNSTIIKFMDKEGVMFEVASEGELRHVLGIGIESQKVVFSGQGKTKSGLISAIKNEVLAINIESLRELNDTITISKELNKSTKIILRINPMFNNEESALKMGGIPSSYGIDEEQLFVFLSQNESKIIDGLFTYIGSNYHNYKYIVENTRYLFELAEKLYDKYNIKLRYLDFGGGFGIPEFDTDPELDMTMLAIELNKLFEEKLSLDCFTDIERLFFESGRYLTARSAVLVTRVIDVKISRGKKYVILDGGINCLGIKQMEYRRVEPCLQLVKTDGYIEESEEVCIVGTTCTPIDVVHKGVTLPIVEIGDYIYFNECGAYSLEFSPQSFCGQVSPAEHIIKDNQIFTMRNRGNYNSPYGCLFTNINV